MNSKFKIGNNRYLSDRYDIITNNMLSSGSAVINQFSNNRNEVVGASRFFNNPRVELDDLIAHESESNDFLVSGLHVLSIQDTSKVNFIKNENKLDFSDVDLGEISRSGGLGFFIHPSLVVNAATGFPLCFSDIKIFNRNNNNTNKYDREYKKLPIEEKESYRWIESAVKSQKNLKSANMVTFITDREGDIYDLYDQVPSDNQHILIRVTHNRKLYKSNEKIFDSLDKCDISGTYEKEINGDTRINRSERIASLNIKFKNINILVPKNHITKNKASDFVNLTIIEVRESAETVPDGEEPILWRLVTSHEVNNFEDAKKIVHWYTLRWLIEELFRLLKKKGLQLESSQLETGIALKKLSIFALKTALILLQLVKGRDGDFNENANTVFSSKEIKFMKKVRSKIEGNTIKQKNKFEDNSLAWAIWFIARLGGWKGDNKKVKPGPITMKKGMVKFAIMFEGWSFALDMIENEVVCIE